MPRREAGWAVYQDRGGVTEVSVYCCELVLSQPCRFRLLQFEAPALSWIVILLDVVKTLVVSMHLFSIQLSVKMA